MKTNEFLPDNPEPGSTQPNSRSELRYQLEWLDVAPSEPSKPSRVSSVSFWLGHIKHWLVGILCDRHDPQIWQKRDANGCLWWWVYDPITDERARFMTETEVMVWLESRYNRPTPGPTHLNSTGLPWRW